MPEIQRTIQSITPITGAVDTTIKFEAENSSGSRQIPHDSMTAYMRDFAGVDTAAQLGTITGKTNGESLRTLGALALGDGGGGTWYYDSADAISVANVGTIVASADGKRWKRSDTAERWNAKWFGLTGDGVTDQGTLLRSFVAICTAASRVAYFPPGTYLASALNEGSNIINVLSLSTGAKLHFEPDSLIRVTDNPVAWTRVLRIQNASNVTISGKLKVDGRVSTVIGGGNEHMHGLFIFNGVNITIQDVESVNCRGDNIFVGGTDETTFSNVVNIGLARCSIAGRKAFTIHMVDNLNVTRLLCDQSAGGAACYGGTALTTDQHCVDLEPDTFTGAKIFKQYFGSIVTIGSGNDFTAGTTAVNAEKWILSVDNWDDTIIGAAALTQEFWTQYGVTINIGYMRMRGVRFPNGFIVQYGGRLNISQATIEGNVAGFVMLIAFSASEQPIARFGSLTINNSSATGSGINNTGGVLIVNALDVTSTGGAALNINDTTAGALQSITDVANLVTRNSGAASAQPVFIGRAGGAGFPIVRIGNWTVLDTRGVKAARAIYQDVNVAPGVFIGFIGNVANLASEVVFGGADKFYRIGGGATNAGSVFVCEGTPESMVTAPVGSMALRRDGGAATTLYIKQTGVGNTGWIGK